MAQVQARGKWAGTRFVSAAVWTLVCMVCLAVLGALLAGCGATSTAGAQQDVTATTPRPTATATATATPRPLPTPTPNAAQMAALAAINNEDAANFSIPIPIAGVDVTVDPPAPDGAYTVHDTLGQNLSNFRSPESAAAIIESDAYDIMRALYHDTTIRPSELTIIIYEYSGKRVGRVTVDAFTAERWDWTRIWCAGTWYFASLADQAWLDPSLPAPTLDDPNFLLPPAFMPQT